MTKKEIMLGQSLRLSQICLSDTDQRGNEPSSSFKESGLLYSGWVRDTIKKGMERSDNETRTC